MNEFDILARPEWVLDILSYYTLLSPFVLRVVLHFTFTFCVGSRHSSNNPYFVMLVFGFYSLDCKNEVFWDVVFGSYYNSVVYVSSFVEEVFCW